MRSDTSRSLKAQQATGNVLDGCGGGERGPRVCVLGVLGVRGPRWCFGASVGLPGVLQAHARFLELSLSLKHWDVPA